MTFFQLPNVSAYISEAWKNQKRRRFSVSENDLHEQIIKVTTLSLLDRLPGTGQCVLTKREPETGCILLMWACRINQVPRPDRDMIRLLRCPVTEIC